jgi:hypothetical protein
MEAYLWFAAFLIAGVVTLIKIFNPDKNLTTRLEMKNDGLSSSKNVAGQDAGNAYIGMSTPELVKALLHDMGCEYHVDEDGDLVTKYQGETFCLRVRDDNPWLVIWDYAWLGVSSDNLEEVSCLQRAINTSNIRQFCTAVYSIDTENKEMTVHSNWFGIVSSELPDVKQYLTVVFGFFFQQHQILLAEFNKEKVKMGLEIQ